MSGGIAGLMLGGALLSWSAVAYKLVALWRRPSNPAAWAYWAGFLTLALNMTLLMPPITSGIDRAIGVESVAYLICDVAALLTCWIWLVCLYQLNKPDRQAARMVRRFGALVAVAVMYFLLRFAVAPGRVQHQLSVDPRDFYLAGYRLIFVGLIALHMGYCIVLLRRYAAEVQRSSLRLRLRFMQLAAGLVIGFSLNESLRIMHLPSPEIMSALFLVAAVLAMVVGLTFSRRLDRALVAARDYWQFFRLYPLWQALYPVRPELSFLPEPCLRRRCFPQEDLVFAICRQITEIRDWAVALRAFQGARLPDVTERAGFRAGTSTVDHAARSEARQLALAVHAWRSRGASAVTPESSPSAATDSLAVSAPLSGAADWREEAAHLVRVSDHFVRYLRGLSR
jgi:hypothetical protein